jgi:broad specificity phosphatase PhoE
LSESTCTPQDAGGLHEKLCAKGIEQEVTLTRLKGRIILGRHGQTEFNRDGLIMGRVDSLLTTEARLRVRNVARMLASEGISAIYSSPLGRAAFTSSIYSEVLGAPVSFRPEMSELSCGEWEGRSRAEVAGDSSVLRKTWHDKPPQGESYRDAEARVGQFVEDLADRVAQDATILVVGHAGVDRVVLKLLLALDPSEAMRILCPHDLVYIVHGDGAVRHKGLGVQEGDGLLYEP